MALTSNEQNQQPAHESRDTSETKKGVTISRRTLVIGGSLATALAIGTGVLLGRGGDSSVGAAPATSTAEAPASPDAQATSPVEADTPQPTDIPGESGEGPIVNAAEANPLGLEQKSYQEIMAYGTPMDILTIPDPEVVEQADFLEQAEERLSRALQVWANVDDPNVRASYENIIFAQPRLTNRESFAPLLFDGGRMDAFYTARDSYRDMPDPGLTGDETARQLTMEVGFNITALNENTVLNGIQHDLDRTKAVIGIGTADLQYGTRAAGTEDNIESIGVDYELATLPAGLELQVNNVTYTGLDGQERTGQFLQIAFDEAKL